MFNISTDMKFMQTKVTCNLRRA